jgi:hypothetical protein
MKNQSRLDFFLVSETILDSVSSCKIAGSLQNKLFDHKAVTLILNEKVSNVISRPTISNKDLKDDLLDFVVKVSTAETYLLHCPLNTIDGRNKNFLLNTCGTIRRLIRDCGPPAELCIGADVDPEAAVNRERKKNRLQVLSHSINLNILEYIPLNCEPDVFFETLLINIKNDTISHQSYVRKTKRQKVLDLQKKIANLKKNSGRK